MDVFSYVQRIRSSSVIPLWGRHFSLAWAPLWTPAASQLLYCRLLLKAGWWRYDFQTYVQDLTLCTTPFFVWVAVAPWLWHPNWILHPTPSSTPPWHLRWKLLGHCISSIFGPPKLMRLNTCLTVSMWAARIKYPCAKARKVYASRGQSVQKGPFFRLRKKYRETITNTWGQLESS